MVLGLGLALVPRVGGPFVQPADAVRGVATVVAGLLLLRSGACPRGRTYVAQHVAAALPVLWGVVDAWAASEWPPAAMLTVVALTTLALPFVRRPDEVRPWRDEPVPQLLALTLGAMALSWGALSLAFGAQGLTTLRGFGLDPLPFWWLAVLTGTVVVAQEVAPVPVHWRWVGQVACGAVMLTYALLVPLRAPSAYWILNTATIVRGAALLALPLLRGRALLETSAYADRLTVALIGAVVGPLAVVVAWVMYLVEESAITAVQRNAVLGATLVAAVGGSFLARAHAGELTAELRGFSQRLGASIVGARGPFVDPGASRELRRVSERLEQLLGELDERAQERQGLLQRLRRQNEAVAQASTAKDEFLNLVSHELRTPLTIIVANARLLRERGGRLPLIEASAALDDVCDASERLGTVVDSLLTLARPQDGLGLEVQPLRVMAVVGKAVMVHRQLHPERRVCVDAPDEQLICDGDPSALVTVLTHLLSNAEKYSPPQGTIDVEVRRFGPHVRIVIGDRGIGIAIEDVARLFEPFHRGADVAEAAPGLGMGLAVSRKLMLAMGGGIAGHLRLGGGAEFELLLPLPRLEAVD